MRIHPAYGSRPDRGKGTIVPTTITARISSLSQYLTTNGGTHPIQSCPA